MLKDTCAVCYSTCRRICDVLCELKTNPRFLQTRRVVNFVFVLFKYFSIMSSVSPSNVTPRVTSSNHAINTRCFKRDRSTLALYGVPFNVGNSAFFPSISRSCRPRSLKHFRLDRVHRAQNRSFDRSEQHDLCMFVRGVRLYLIIGVFSHCSS